MPAGERASTLTFITRSQRSGVFCKALQQPHHVEAMPSAKPAILQQVSSRNHNSSIAIATAKQALTLNMFQPDRSSNKTGTSQKCRNQAAERSHLAESTLSSKYRRVEEKISRQL
jgi:hypothetical protein